MQTRAYQITDRPGVTLCVGVPSGRQRPALYIILPETGRAQHILAQFHGEVEAKVASNFLDATIGQIQRVIDHLASGET